MCQLLDIAIILLLPWFIYLAYTSNLFECARMTGRYFFAFLLASVFFCPLSRFIGDANVPFLPEDYLPAMAFGAIWITIFILVKKTQEKLLPDLGDKMDFSYERPGKILCGLISGFFLAVSLVYILVMLPPVEGLYYEHSCQLTPKIYKTGNAIYRAFTFSLKNPCERQRMCAGAIWLQTKIENNPKINPYEIKSLLHRFPQRYIGDPITSKDFVDQREKYINTISHILQKHNPPESNQTPTKKEPKIPETIPELPWALPNTFPLGTNNDKLHNQDYE